jgi:uncharacterized protein YPO0396
MPESLEKERFMGNLAMDELDLSGIGACLSFGFNAFSLTPRKKIFKFSDFARSVRFLHIRHYTDLI